MYYYVQDNATEELFLSHHNSRPVVYSVLSSVFEISEHKRKQPPPTVTKKVKVKVLVLHQVCWDGGISCLFPTGIQNEFKAFGISDNMPFSLLLPFGPIILGCLISNGTD